MITCTPVERVLGTHLEASGERVLDAEQVLEDQLAEAEKIQEALVGVQPQVIFREVGEGNVLQVNLVCTRPHPPNKLSIHLFMKNKIY